MARNIRIPDFLKQEGTQDESGKAGVDLAAGVASPDAGAPEAGTGASAPELAEQPAAEAPLRKPEVSVRRPVGRPRKKESGGATAEQLRKRVDVSSGVFAVLLREKYRRYEEGGEIVALGGIVSEALAFYLRKTRRDAYEEYRSKGLLQ